jgi:hypothetical protein
MMSRDGHGTIDQSNQCQASPFFPRGGNPYSLTQSLLILRRRYVAGMFNPFNKKKKGKEKEKKKKKKDESKPKERKMKEKAQRWEEIFSSMIPLLPGR